MKVVLSEKCRYNPKAGRSKNWHRDYKQLVRMQNHGKAKNEYLSDVVTTFRDNGNTILKATYTPVLSSLPTMLGIKSSNSGAAGMPGGAGATGQAHGGMPSTAPTGGSMPTTGGGMPQGK